MSASRSSTTVAIAIVLAGIMALLVTAILLLD